MRRVFSNSKEDSRIIVMLSDSSDKDLEAGVNLQQISETVKSFDVSSVALQSIVYYLHYQIDADFQNITLHIHIERDKCVYHVKYDKGVLVKFHITEKENEIYYTLKYESEKLNECEPRIVTENMRFNMYGSKGQIVHCGKHFRKFQDKFWSMLNELRSIEIY